MSENVYEKLRELLDIHPFGLPPAPEIIEILKILFTEEEAEVSLGLSFRPLNARKVADRAGVGPQEAIQRLESLANKALIFARKKNDEWGYALVGLNQIFESVYWKGVHDETTNKLTPLWEKYNSIVMPNYCSPNASFLRVIPIQEKIESMAEVLSYEKIYEMIDQAKVMGITHCPCREAFRNCEAPRETCMLFDEMCTFMVERGFARYLTKEKMKQKLRECDEAGLVHQTMNTQDKLQIVCNCCPCCCGMLRALTEHGNPNAFVRSAFLPVTDVELCEGCGTCVEERCPMKALAMVDEKPILNNERCIGCGLCATGCPNDARRMEKSVDVSEPLSNFMELGGQILQDLGKLEAYMQFNSSVAKPSD